MVFYCLNFFVCSFVICCRVVCSFATSILCARIPGLSLTQRQLCAESPDAVVALGAGHILGSHECQHQFKGKLWNYTFLRLCFLVGAVGLCVIIRKIPKLLRSRFENCLFKFVYKSLRRRVNLPFPPSHVCECIHEIRL